MKHRMIQLKLNQQQRELLLRAASAENLPSIEALVRHAISQSDKPPAQEKLNV